MKVNDDGCVLCGSTWGNYWRRVDQDTLFFCCSICADSFSNMIAKIKELTNGEAVEELTIEGDIRGRRCTAQTHSRTVTFTILFTEEGKIQSFKVLSRQ